MADREKKEEKTEIRKCEMKSIFHNYLRAII